MRKSSPWNRRDFLQAMGCSSLSLMNTRLAWTMGTPKPVEPRFAYVSYDGTGSTMGSDPNQGIQVFAVEGGCWKKVQAVASERPTFLALHPNQQFLYAINEVDSYQCLPSGVVEAFSIDPLNGHLTLLNRQPLALSATSPRHMAIAPDGSAVVIAVHGGGSYNVLPIKSNGELERVSGILKEIGASVDEEHQTAAHPQMVMFDPTGNRLLGADLGSDRLSVFTLTGDKLATHERNSSRAGSGPSQMALHPDGHLLFVANGLESSVMCYRYDAKDGRILDQLEHVSTLQSGAKTKAAVAMSMHPSGNFLYTVNRHVGSNRSSGDGVTLWRVHAGTGSLTPVQFEAEGIQGVHSMVSSTDGRSLLLLSHKRNGVLRLRIDPASGRMSELTQVAKASSPISLAMKYV